MGRQLQSTCQLHPFGGDHLVAPGVHIAVRCQHHCVALCSRHCRDALALQGSQTAQQSHCSRASSAGTKPTGTRPSQLRQGARHQGYLMRCVRRGRRAGGSGASVHLHGLHDAGDRVAGGVGGPVAQLPLQVAAPAVGMAALHERHGVPVRGRHRRHALTQQRHPARSSEPHMPAPACTRAPLGGAGPAACSPGSAHSRSPQPPVSALLPSGSADTCQAKFTFGRACSTLDSKQSGGPLCCGRQEQKLDAIPKVRCTMSVVAMALGAGDGATRTEPHLLGMGWVSTAG